MRLARAVFPVLAAWTSLASAWQSRQEPDEEVAPEEGEEPDNGGPIAAVANQVGGGGGDASGWTHADHMGQRYGGEAGGEQGIGPGNGPGNGPGMGPGMGPGAGPARRKNWQFRGGAAAQSRGYAGGGGQPHALSVGNNHAWGWNPNWNQAWSAGPPSWQGQVGTPGWQHAVPNPWMMYALPMMRAMKGKHEAKHQKRITLSEFSQKLTSGITHLLKDLIGQLLGFKPAASTTPAPAPVSGPNVTALAAGDAGLPLGLPLDLPLGPAGAAASPPLGPAPISPLAAAQRAQQSAAMAMAVAEAFPSPQTQQAASEAEAGARLAQQIIGQAATPLA